MFSGKLQSATAGAPANYIEDVFSTYIYTGNWANQTINNGIDLAGKGGLVWVKERSAEGWDHSLMDTARGAGKILRSSNAGAQLVGYGQTFTNSGFGLDGDANYNASPSTYASWTFRKQPKFFDVVTYTGNGLQDNKVIPHGLGSTPGAVFIKAYSGSGEDALQNWAVYHRSLASEEFLRLNSTNASQVSGQVFRQTPDATNIYVGDNPTVNKLGVSYVAYLFAHNAGGFGTAGTDNVISCGGFTADGAGAATVNLGYEPQWLLVKRTSSATDWQIYDNMRGFTVDNVGQLALRPNTATAESAAYPYAVNATGFSLTGVGAGNTFVYIAIRKGPMKVPTDGTKVFAPLTTTGAGNSVRSFTGVGFPPDLVFPIMRASPGNHYLGDRLRGSGILKTKATDAEDSGYVKSYDQDGWTTQSDAFGNSFGYAFINYLFRRAPGFFDEVCYTGTGVDLTLSHNLQAVPQMIICKSRSGTDDWSVYQQYSYNGFYGGIDLALPLNGTTIYSTLGFWKAIPTSSVFYLPSDTYTTVNTPGQTYVAYLFATCPGVSKVGSYTGTGATQTIACGFAAGARFVLIRRTNSPGGDWYVWDTARGIVAGNDPYLLLNSTAAEVTGTDYIDPVSTGFQISSTAPAAINASGGSYIFFAVA